MASTATSAATSTQELATFSNAGWQNDSEEQLQQEQDYQTLAPADSGKQAYTFLAACVGLEALVWGFPFAVSWIHNNSLRVFHLSADSICSSHPVWCLRIILRPT